MLAAGYGTRMRALIGDTPKALVRLGDRTIMDYLYDNLAELGIEIVIVTNDRYRDRFAAWREARGARCTLISDGTTEPDRRLGAIGDLALAIERLDEADDLLVTAADNLIPFPLAALVEEFDRKPGFYIAVWNNDDLTDQVRRGVVEISRGVITRFEEKPQNPSSPIAAAPLYILPRALADEVALYLRSDRNPDAPGYLMAWLVGRHRAYPWSMPEIMLDVGNPDSYRTALARFSA